MKWRFWLYGTIIGVADVLLYHFNILPFEILVLLDLGMMVGHLHQIEDEEE